MAWQDIDPINDQLVGVVVRAADPWLESESGKAWIKVPWTGQESGRWAALFRWKKDYAAAK